MEWKSLLTSLLALVFVLCLIGITSYLIRRLGSGHLRVTPLEKGPKRLGIVEVMNLDVRRRLVLVRRDNTEHLLLLAPDRELLIENVGGNRPIAASSSAAPKGRKK
jgi:flagellar protein FliO/FliZ